MRNEGVFSVTVKVGQNSTIAFMKNIELKVSVDGFEEIIRLLKKMGAHFKGTLQQVDTYYEVGGGRLKIREINNRKFELIFYERPNKRGARISDYHLVAIRPKQLHSVKLILQKTARKGVVVRKQRRLWLYENTRIHLDKVRGLGPFLELETAIKDGRLSQAKQEFRRVSDFLGLSGFKRFGKSYSDMLALKAKDRT